MTNAEFVTIAEKYNIPMTTDSPNWEKCGALDIVYEKLQNWVGLRKTNQWLQVYCKMNSPHLKPDQFTFYRKCPSLKGRKTNAKQKIK